MLPWSGSGSSCGPDKENNNNSRIEKKTEENDIGNAANNIGTVFDMGLLGLANPCLKRALLTPIPWFQVSHYVNTGLSMQYSGLYLDKFKILVPPGSLLHAFPGSQIQTLDDPCDH